MGGHRGCCRSAYKPVEWLVWLSLITWSGFGYVTGYAYAARDIDSFAVAFALTVFLPVVLAKTIVKKNAWWWVGAVLLVAWLGALAAEAYRLRGDNFGIISQAVLVIGLPLGAAVREVIGTLAWRREWRRNWDPRRRS